MPVVLARSKQEERFEWHPFNLLQEPEPDATRRFLFFPSQIEGFPNRPLTLPCPMGHCDGSACREPRRYTVLRVPRAVTAHRHLSVGRPWCPRRCERKVRTATAGYRRAHRWRSKFLDRWEATALVYYGRGCPFHGCRRCAFRPCRRFRLECPPVAICESPRAQLRDSGCSDCPTVRVPMPGNSRSRCA